MAHCEQAARGLSPRGGGKETKRSLVPVKCTLEALRYIYVLHLISFLVETGWDYCFASAEGGGGRCATRLYASCKHTDAHTHT